MTPKQFLVVGVLLIALMIAPASAKIVITAEPFGVVTHAYGDQTSFDYDASTNNEAIQRMTIDAPIGTTVSYTLYHSNGSTVTGSVQFVDSASVFGWGYATSYIDLGGLTSSYTFLTNMGIGRIYLYGYAKNETSTDIWQNGFVVAGTTAGITTFDNDVVFYPVTGTGDGVIYRVTFTASQPVACAVYTNSRSAVVAATSKTIPDIVWEWINFGISIAGTVYTIALMGFSGLLFLLENWYLILALYIGLTGAIAFNQSKDIFSALRTFFRYQRSVYEFFLNMWHSLISLISSFRDIFRL